MRKMRRDAECARTTNETNTRKRARPPDRLIFPPSERFHRVTDVGVCARFGILFARLIRENNIVREKKIVRKIGEKINSKGK